MAKEIPPTGAASTDWKLLAPLLAHVILTHFVVTVVRMTVSYRTVELGLSAIWVGIISAGFAIIPIFIAVRIGRYIDRGHDARAAWIGSAIVVVASMAFWLWPGSAIWLLLFTVALGTGHMFLMAAHQMLTVRSGNAHARDSIFGHFMVAISIGQGLGPLVVGMIGGGAAVPDTAPLFMLGALMAILVGVVVVAIRPAPLKEARGEAKAVPLIALLRRPGVAAVIIASVVTVTASDLLVIYLPLLGTERHIEVSHIGMLLTVKSAAALVVRMFYARLIFTFGRLPLTLGSTFIGAAAMVLLAVPSLPVMYVAAVALGVGLGIASTLTLSGIVEVAPPEARATAMTLRIMGNRMGLVTVPFLAGVIAAATGVVGVLALTATSLSACAVGLGLSQRRR
jgi:MFS family permease